MIYNNGSLNRPEDVVYPGNYVSLINDTEVMNELNIAMEKAVNNFPIVMTDLPDLLEVEIAIPGIKREEFFIHAEGNVLSVTVLHKTGGKSKSENSKLPDFKYMGFEKHIVLPANVDLEFFSAEYTEGILCFHLSKTKIHVSNRSTRIVVY